MMNMFGIAGLPLPQQYGGYNYREKNFINA
jgi:hypothetical protein